MMLSFPQDVTYVITHLRPAGISQRQKSPAKVSTQPELSGTILGGWEPLTITCAFVPAWLCGVRARTFSSADG